jgi:uncharacterized membrane protein (UPF0127 family)
MKKQHYYRRFIHNKALLNSVLCVSTLGFLILLYSLLQFQSGAQKQVCIQAQGLHRPASACAFRLDSADTLESRERGLSGRSSLPADMGMLFVFDKIGTECMWMKDMHFPLDIVWLNSQDTVVKLAENLSPESYPQQYCADNTLFVIEVSGGTAKNINATVGSHIEL